MRFGLVSSTSVFGMYVFEQPDTNPARARSATGAAEARARIAEEGVLVGLLRPGVLRVALHLGITDEDVDRAGELIPRALAPVAA